MRVLALIGVMALIAGCATRPEMVWTGGASGAFAQQRNDCYVQAKQVETAGVLSRSAAYGGGFVASLAAARESDTFMEQCMQAKGWRLVEKVEQPVSTQSQPERPQPEKVWTGGDKTLFAQQKSVCVAHSKQPENESKRCDVLMACMQAKGWKLVEKKTVTAVPPQTFLSKPPLAIRRDREDRPAD